MSEGVKFDDGKLRYDLIHPEFLEGMATVLTQGAEKYDDENYKKVPNPQNRYYAAAMRHLEAFRMGEDYDFESGESHLVHAAVNIMFLHWFECEEINQFLDENLNDCDCGVGDEFEVLQIYLNNIERNR